QPRAHRRPRDQHRRGRRLLRRGTRRPARARGPAADDLATPRAPVQGCIRCGQASLVRCIHAPSRSFPCHTSVTARWDARWIASLTSRQRRAPSPGENVPLEQSTMTPTTQLAEALPLAPPRIEPTVEPPVEPAAIEDPIFDIRSLSLWYGEKKALKEISLQIP